MKQVYVVMESIWTGSQYARFPVEVFESHADAEILASQLQGYKPKADCEYYIEIVDFSPANKGR